MLYGECLALTTALLWGTIPVVVRKALPYSSASVAVRDACEDPVGDRCSVAMIEVPLSTQ